MGRTSRTRLSDLARLVAGGAAFATILGAIHQPLGVDLIHTNIVAVVLLGLASLLALSGLIPLFAHEGFAVLEFDLVRTVLGAGAAVVLISAYQLPLSSGMFATAPAGVVIGFGAAVLLGLSGFLPMLGTLLRTKKDRNTGEKFLAQRVPPPPGVDLSWGQPLSVAEYHVDDDGPTPLGPSLQPGWVASAQLPPAKSDWPQHMPNQSPFGPRRPNRYPRD